MMMIQIYDIVQILLLTRIYVAFGHRNSSMDFLHQFQTGVRQQEEESTARIIILRKQTIQ